MNDQQNQTIQQEAADKGVDSSGGDGGEEKPCSECLDESMIANNNNINNRTLRKTWKTSPEQVEELTRSLSRMKNDEHGNTRIMEKTYQKAKSKITGGRDGATKNVPDVKSNKTTPMNKKKIPSDSQYSMPVKVISTAKTLNGTISNIPQQPGFLPPLTGFSDSDSSFSSIVCSSEDCDKIHCICETLKKTHLEKHELMDHEHRHLQQRSVISDNGINYINLDNDNWIVMRPKRARPRDNLKLEGPMDLETTFGSTYGRGVDKPKQSNDGGSNLGQKQSPQLYCNTRRGRNSGSTPLLRSAKRKIIRNRPRTSLKTGGHGYWSTNNRDAYKNFIIVNGEAKTVSDTKNHLQSSSQIKLPKVVSKTTMMTSEEKNRCKYDVNQTMDSNVDLDPVQTKSLLMRDEEEIRKFEKKSYIQTSDGGGELTAEKLVKKVRCQGGNSGQNQSKLEKNKELKTMDDDNVLEEEEIKHENKVQITDINISKYRPYDAYQVDHIKDFGLLEMKSNPDEEDEFSRNIDSNYRPHLRRLHETSDDFHILTSGIRVNGSFNGSKTKTKSQTSEFSLSEQNKKIAMQQPQEKPLVVNGHAVMAASKKPFIFPQRIQRHKNESSINMFEGDMEFTTTNKSTYRNGGEQQQRKRTAGRRSQKSGRRRNLFRQSSDSIFARPESNDNQNSLKKQQRTNNNKKNPSDTGPKQESQVKETIYKSEFGDRSLYCPALDVVNTNQYKMTSEAGGHKYYNLQNKFS